MTSSLYAVLKILKFLWASSFTLKVSASMFNIKFLSHFYQSLKLLMLTRVRQKPIADKLLLMAMILSISLKI